MIYGFSITDGGTPGFEADKVACGILIAVVSKFKVEFNYSTIASTIQLCPQRSKKALHYQCFPENLGKRFVRVGSLNPRLVLINH